MSGHVAWFRHPEGGRWQPMLNHESELVLRDRAAVHGANNGLEWVVLPRGVVPDQNDGDQMRKAG